MKPVKVLQKKIFLLTVPRRNNLLWIICIDLCLEFVLNTSLFISALWSPEGKGLTSWLLFVMFIVFVTFQFGILGQVWYLIVSIPDPCCLSIKDLHRLSATSIQWL